ncbi:hypothetical protein [Massilia sp. DD77]|uniref:hypothetical protein n=1 Tax=Massilia sp. DD77 TaxID=3109349 RepID=UPI002FFFE5B3
MSQVQVRILCQVITAQLGTLNTGDIVRTDEAFAKHLVDDCGAAEYLQPMQPESADAEQSSARSGKSRKTPAQKSLDAGPAPAVQNPAPPTPSAAPVETVQTSAPQPSEPLLPPSIEGVVSVAES